MRKLFIPVLCCLATAAVHAQDINAKEVKRIISVLAADDMEGRKTFEPGVEKAAVFIEKEFGNIGLAPLPGSSGFRQSFHMYRNKPGKTQLWINGALQDVTGRILIFGADSHINWNQDSRIDIAEITAKDNFYEQIQKLKQGPRSAIAWVDTAHAAKFAGYYNYVQQNGNQQTDSGRNVILVLKQATATDIRNWEIKADQEVTTLPLCNIAGIIKGSSRPEEYVIFSAHYDHIGILPPVAGDSIANGADDDASGVTAVISLARYFKKQHPARTLLFVTFTGEEMGGYGSQYFSRQLPLEKVVAMFNIEMIGKESKFGRNSAFITGYERSDFGPILQRNLQQSDFHFYPDPYPEQQLFFRSDNATLARLGVPAHTISTTQIDKDKLYHSVDDEVESLDMQNIADIIKAIATSSRSIVDGKDTPTRITNTER